MTEEPSPHQFMASLGNNIADLQSRLLKEKERFELRGELVRGHALDESDVEAFSRMYKLTAGYLILVETIPGGMDMPALRAIYDTVTNNFDDLNKVLTAYMTQEPNP